MSDVGINRLPERLLKDPKWVEACRSRDFGSIFTLVRRAGLYQGQIAQRCDLTPSRVSDVIAGRRTLTHINVVERIADGIRIPGHQLGLAPREWESSPGAGTGHRAPGAGAAESPASPASEHAVPRQRPGVGVTAAPAAPDDDEVSELKRELLATASADASVANLFSTQVNTMRQLDRQLGAGTLLPQLQAQVQHMEHLLRFGSSPAVRAALASALTEASSLAAWQALDLGRYRDSWNLHETAKSAAREADSPSLLAHATAQQAYVLLEVSSPKAAVEQVRYAREQAGSALPPLMKSWLLAAEAEAHAAAENEATCRWALDRAEAIRPADPSDPNFPFLFLGGSHLARWRGNCLATLGADEALDDLTAAIDSMDGFTRAEAGVRCDLAVVLKRRGELDEARKQAARAQDLAARTSSVRQRRRIARVLKATVA